MIDYRVSRKAKIGKNVTLGMFCVIGDGVELQDGVTIGPGAIVGHVPTRGLTARDPGPPGPTLIGAGTHIGAHAVVYAGACIGERCLVGDHVHIREGVVLGAEVRLASHVSVNYETTIGAGTVVMQGTHLTGKMSIGHECFIGPLVVTMNHREPRNGFVSDEVRGPTIGDGVLIGGGACITRDVPAGATVLGQAAQLRDDGPIVRVAKRGRA